MEGVGLRQRLMGFCNGEMRIARRDVLRIDYRSTGPTAEAHRAAYFAERHVSSRVLYTLESRSSDRDHSEPMKTIFALLTLFFLNSFALPGTASAQQADETCQALKAEIQHFESMLRDWPNLAKYRDADSQLGPAAKTESRVVFLGDSITEFWNLADSFPGKPYVNRGITGQTTPQILLRFRQDVIALNPKVVVILAGTNDIAENTGPITVEGIEDNLTSMVELAQKNGIRVVLSSVLPVARFPWRPEIQPIDKIQALNRWMKEYAARSGVDFLDYYAAMVDQKSGLKPELGLDGVHPNPAGYAIMTQLVSKMIGGADRGR